MRISRSALSVILSASLVVGLVPVAPRVAWAETEEMPAEEALVPAEEAAEPEDGQAATDEALAEEPSDEEPSDEGQAEGDVTPEEEPAEAERLLQTELSAQSEEPAELFGSAPLRGITFAEGPSEDLLDGYVERRMAEEIPSEGLVLLAQSRPSGTDADVYDLLRGYIAEVAAGKRTSTVFEVPASVMTGSGKTSWTAADLGVSSVLTPDGTGISDEAIDALYEHVFPDFDSILLALAMDCPYDLYWFDKSEGVLYGATDFGASYKGGQWSLHLRGDMSVQFAVAKGYAASTYQVNASTGARVEKAVATAKQIVDESAGMAPYERLAHFRARICALVSYDHAAARGNATTKDPWQLISVFDGDGSTNVVCEGYAKAFKYLCDLAGIDGVECRLVTGTMTGGTGAGSHMWNVVRMPDGKNYLVDLTNCDSGTIGANDLLFVAPYASGSVAGGYTLKPGGGTIKYTYDSDTRGFYGTSELTLSSTKYATGSEEGSGESGEGSGQDSGQEVVPQPKKSIAGATVTASKQTYTGSAHTPTVTVKLGGATLRAGTDFVVSGWKNNTNVGTANVTVTGKGDYEGTASGTFVIAARSLDGATVSAVADQAYTGSAITPVPTVKVGTTTLVRDTDYAISYQDNVGPGSALVTITGKGNYTGSRTVTFRIVQKSLADATVAAIANQAYTGTAVTPKPVVKLAGVTLKEGTDYRLSYRNNVSAGTATVTITGTGKYGGSKTATFKIIQASLESAVISPIANQTYTGRPIMPSLTVKVGSTTLRQNSDYTLTYKNNTAVGTATVLVTGKGGYIGTKNVTFIIVAMRGTWKKSSGKWWYEWANGSYPKSQFLDIDGSRYFFDASGWMKTGWLQTSGCWYYFSSGGAMTTGWKMISGTWYWFSPQGKMATGWQDISGSRYWFKSSGAMATGWQQISGKWYFFANSGAMLRGKWQGNYYLQNDGTMATSTWIGNYHVDASGKWDKTR